MFDESHQELGRRAKRLLDLADWDDYVTDNVIAGWLRIRRMGNLVVIESIPHAQTVYSEHLISGVTTAWNDQLIPEALEALRKHMILDDLADV